MSSPFALGSIIHNRYLIKQLIKQSPFESLYLAEDKRQSSERCLIEHITLIEDGKTIATGEALREELDLVWEHVTFSISNYA